MKVSTSVYLPQEMKEQVEHYAAKTKRSASAVVELALENFLARDEVKEIVSGAVHFNNTGKGGEAGISG